MTRQNSQETLWLALCAIACIVLGLTIGVSLGARGASSSLAQDLEQKAK